MKRSNILFVVALAVMVLMLGPLSAMASPITLTNVTQQLQGSSTCLSGSCGTHDFGTHNIPNADQKVWKVNEPAFNGVLFDLDWTAPAARTTARVR